MPVGTSDGQYYESDLHALFDIKPNEDAPRKAQDASKSPEVLGVADKNKLTSEAPSPAGEAPITKPPVERNTEENPLFEYEDEGQKYHFRFTPEMFDSKKPGGFGSDPIHEDWDKIFRFKNGDYGVHIAPPVPKPDPGVPVGSNPSASDIASMTHQQEQPNPAAPYVKGAMQFAEGGISRVLGENQPEWSKKLGEKLSSPEANAALGIFGGRYTVTAKSLAEAMEAKGMSEKSIKYMTGLERGSEGKWRSEIDDSAAKVHPEVLKSGDTHNLEDVLDHPELYKKYPEARNLSVSEAILDKHTSGLYYPDLQHIALSPSIKSESKFKETLLHEVQHWVQQKEGFDFVSGVNKPKFLQKEILQKLADKHLGEYKEALIKAVEEGDVDTAAAVRKQMKTYEDYLIYRAAPVEAEAHNTEGRIQLNKKQRLESLAKETEFPSREHQLIETIKSK